MTAAESRKRLLSALAMLGVVPALVVIPTHVAAERVRAAWPALDRALAEMDDALRRGVACAEGGTGGGRVSEEQFRRLSGRLHNTRGSVAMAAQGATENWFGEALGESVPGASGVPEAQVTAIALGQDLNQLQDDVVCDDIGQNPERVSAEQVRTDQLLATFHGRLTVHATRFSAARASLEAGRPVLTALAWILGVIEAVGCAVTLWLLPRDLRTLMARRVARRGGSGGTR